jgi:hypothetical protein
MGTKRLPRFNAVLPLQGFGRFLGGFKFWKSLKIFPEVIIFREDISINLAFSGYSIANIKQTLPCCQGCLIHPHVARQILLGHNHPGRSRRAIGCGDVAVPQPLLVSHLALLHQHLGLGGNHHRHRCHLHIIAHLGPDDLAHFPAVTAQIDLLYFRAVKPVGTVAIM